MTVLAPITLHAQGELRVIGSPLSHDELRQAGHSRS